MPLPVAMAMAMAMAMALTMALALALALAGGQIIALNARMSERFPEQTTTMPT